MNDRIGDLLDDAADDAGRPLPFTPASLAARGRAVRRRRGVVLGVAAVAAAVVVVGGVAALAGGSDRSSVPVVVEPTASDQATTPPAPAEPTTPPPTTESSLADRRTLRGCDAAGRRPLLADDGWLVDAESHDRYGTTASLVSPDGTQYAACTLWDPGAPVQGDTRGPAVPLDTSPVPDPWPVPDGSVETALLCGKEGPASCVRTLYQAVVPLREGVVDVEVRDPGGVTHPAVVGHDTYVVRFVAPAGATSVAPVVVTLRDTSGAVIARYDYNAGLR